MADHINVAGKTIIVEKKKFQQYNSALKTAKIMNAPLFSEIRTAFIYEKQIHRYLSNANYYQWIFEPLSGLHYQPLLSKRGVIGVVNANQEDQNLIRRTNKLADLSIFESTDKVIKELFTLRDQPKLPQFSIGLYVIMRLISIAFGGIKYRVCPDYFIVFSQARAICNLLVLSAFYSGLAEYKPDEMCALGCAELLITKIWNHSVDKSIIQNSNLEAAPLLSNFAAQVLNQLEQVGVDVEDVYTTALCNSNGDDVDYFNDNDLVYSRREYRFIDFEPHKLESVIYLVFNQNIKPTRMLQCLYISASIEINRVVGHHNLPHEVIKSSFTYPIVQDLKTTELYTELVKYSKREVSHIDSKCYGFEKKEKKDQRVRVAKQVVEVKDSKPQKQMEITQNINFGKVMAPPEKISTPIFGNGNTLARLNKMADAFEESKQQDIKEFNYVPDKSNKEKKLKKDKEKKDKQSGVLIAALKKTFALRVEAKNMCSSADIMGQLKSYLNTNTRFSELRQFWYFRGIVYALEREDLPTEVDEEMMVFDGTSLHLIFDVGCVLSNGVYYVHWDDENCNYDIDNNPILGSTIIYASKDVRIYVKEGPIFRLEKLIRIIKHDDYLFRWYRVPKQEFDKLDSANFKRCNFITCGLDGNKINCIALYDILKNDDGGDFHFMSHKEVYPLIGAIPILSGLYSNFYDDKNCSLMKLFSLDWT